MERTARLAPQDQRALPRLTIQLPAKVFPGALDCRIIDLSAHGARLQFDGLAPQMDEDFVLLELESGRAHEGVAAWTRGSEIGFRMEVSHHVHEGAPPHLEEAARFWLAREGRRKSITTFHVRQVQRSWTVQMEAPSLAEAATVGEFLHRWKAERFAREQVDALREKGVAAAMG
jgi:hypothetical protein